MHPFPHRARWIWNDGEPFPKNFYLYCRREFEAGEKISRAPVHVTADSRYKLFVNGTFVGRGPARCDPRWQYFDTYDIAPFLSPGRNVISATVHQFGIPTHSYMPGRGGFFLEGEVEQPEFDPLVLDTGRDWKILSADAWTRDAPVATWAVMWMELYDARKEPCGWQRAGFDDSQWKVPAELGTPPVAPWVNLVPRDIPFLAERELWPVSVLEHGVVQPAPEIARIPAHEIFGAADWKIAFVRIFLKSPTAQRLAVGLSGTLVPVDHMAWVNGNLVAEARSWQSGVLLPSLSEFSVRPGWNELLLKVAGDGVRGRFDLAVGSADGETYEPVQWHAAQDETFQGRIQLLGPFGDPDTRFDDIYPPEHEITHPAPDRPDESSTVIPIQFRECDNAALRIALETRRPSPSNVSRKFDCLTNENDENLEVATGAGDVYCTLDFGKVLSGYVRLRLRGVAGGVVDLGYSETLLNGHVDAVRFKLNYGDRYTMRDGDQEWETFFYKSFRYVQATFRNCSEPVQIRSISANFTSYPVEYRGQFECSDALLTRIWEVCRWTLQICMHDGYEDTPWREQGQWCGDAQVELLANYMAFGDVALGTKLLRQIAQGQEESGALPCMYPAQTHLLPGGIPPFMAQWVSMLADHYRYTGDSDLVAELFPNVTRLMRFFDGHAGPEGLLRDLPGFVFWDWMPVPDLMPMFGAGSPGERTGMNCFYYRALEDGAYLASVLDRGVEKRDFSAKAEAVKHAINDLFWSEKDSAYLHGRRDGKPIERLSVHDSALAAYSGVASEDRMRIGLHALMNSTNEQAVQIGSPYFYHFYLEGLRRAGMHHEALEVTRRAYGAMLDAGATTFWELFDGEGSHSHAWGAGPLFDLSTYVLGVRPTSPGFASFVVEPHLSGLQWAKGVVPTVRGDVDIEWERSGNTLRLKCKIPFDAEANLNVPAASAAAVSLEGGQSRAIEFEKGRVCIALEGSGTYRVVSELGAG